MLLFVTSNKALATSWPRRPAGRSSARRLSSTDTETILYSKVAAANDAGRTRPSTSRRPPSPPSPCSPTTARPPTPSPPSRRPPRRSTATTHTTPGANVATAGSYVVSYWADKSVRRPPGWTLPAGQTQRSIALGTGAGRITVRRLRPQRAGARTAPHHAAHRHERRLDGQGDDVDRRAPARPDLEPERRPGGVVHRELPAGDLHGRRLGLDRHRPRHRRVLRLGLRRRHDRHRRDHDPHLRHRRRRRRSRSSSPTTRGSRPRRRPARPTRPCGGAGGQRVPGHNRLVPTGRGPTRPRISNGEIWDIEVVGTGNADPGLHRRQLHVGRQHDRPDHDDQPALPARLQPQHRPDRHDLPPDVQRRRRHRGRGHARRHQALRRRLVQHRQRGGPAEGRQPQPHHRRADQHLRLHPEHQQPGHRAGRHQLARSTSAAGSAGSTASSAPAWPR